MVREVDGGSGPVRAPLAGKVPACLQPSVACSMVTAPAGAHTHMQLLVVHTYASTHAAASKQVYVLLTCTVRIPPVKAACVCDRTVQCAHVGL